MQPRPKRFVRDDEAIDVTPEHVDAHSTGSGDRGVLP
jgi:hypothetical protein